MAYKELKVSSGNSSTNVSYNEKKAATFWNDYYSRSFNQRAEARDARNDKKHSGSIRKSIKK